MRHRKIIALGSLLLLPVIATQAHAQEVLSVTEREKLVQSDLGIRLGSFLLLPQIDLSIDHGDNIYATNHDKRGDFYANARAQVDLNSQFARNALDASVYYDRDAYFKLTTENTSQYGANVDGRYDIGGDGSFNLGGGYDRVAESRTSLDSLTTASKPVLYDLFHGDATFTDKFGPLTAVLGGHVRHYNYHDAIFGATRIDQSYRNFTVAQGDVDLAYELHSLTSVVVHGEIERRRYEIGYGDPRFDAAALTDRSANGTRIETGFQHQVTSLIQATARVGWLHYSYIDPRLHSLSAFSYHADLIWNVTPLTTVQASADRRVDETISVTYAGNLRDEVRIDVRHELLRNLILLLDTRYAIIRPTAVNVADAAGQILTRSHEFALGGGAHYYIGRNIRVNVNLEHSQRTSNDADYAYKENIGTVGLTFSR